MAETPFIDASVGGAAVVANILTSEIRATVAGALTILNFPTPYVYAGTVGTVVATSYLAGNIQLSDAGAIVVGDGRIANPKLRAWTFTLDGHDFYVLRLGDDISLVYDVYSEQWMDWSSPDLNFWRLNTGMNWLGGQRFGDSYGSDVIAGDDVHGLIYFLDPEQPYDQSPLDYAEIQEQYFERIVMGQVPIRGRDFIPCYALWLTTDMGNPAYTGAGVTLYTSDDAGVTFDDQGLVTVTEGDYSPELVWTSLGQMSAPGRLFKLVDDGAIARIDCLEMDDPENGG